MTARATLPQREDGEGSPGPVPVRFGLSFGFRNPPPFERPFDAVYADALRIAELADGLGYDSAWISEHHFIEDGYCPAPLAAVAAIAALTDHITVGTKILIAPLHDPLELAEVGAFLDQLSGGRFELGVGVGYRREEFDAKGIPFDRRGRILEEIIEILRLAWTQGVIDFKGEHFKYSGVPIYPQPVRRPHPKIWLGASRGRALERVVRLGFPLMLGSTKEGYHQYLDGLRLQGRDPDRAEVIHSLAALHVDEDGERARRDAWPGVAWLQWRPIGETPPLEQLTRPEAFPQQAKVGYASFVGDPDEVAEGLLEMDRETPLRHVTFHAQIPGLPLTAVARSLELFMREVVPRVSERSARGRAARTKKEQEQR